MNSVYDKCANNYAMLKDLSQRLSYCFQNGFIWLTEQLFPWHGNYFMPYLRTVKEMDKWPNVCSIHRTLECSFICVCLERLCSITGHTI